LIILQHPLKTRKGASPIEIIKKYNNLPILQCYIGQLNQVFINILSNAIDAIEERNKSRGLENIQNNPNTICIGTKVLHNNQVMILLADNGCGMTEEVKQRFFTASLLLNQMVPVQV